MRVIAGRLKGRRLSPPRWAGLRPTSDRLRETLFNILGDRPADARVLDACAGTGALGIEALSRGARHVVFVDRDHRATRLIETNLARCQVGTLATVVCGALPAVARGGALGAPFDLVLLDPPYEDPGIDAILSAVATTLTPEGLLVLERTTRMPTPRVSGLTPSRTSAAGDSALDFFVRPRPDRLAG